MNGLARMREIDWRTSSSRSLNASAAHSGLMPVSSCTERLNSSSVNVSIPQPVWCMRTISFVPSRRCEMARERIASSVTTPPALRITCASPSSSPSTRVGIRRASMQATTATRLAGGRGSSPLSKAWAYCSALRRSSSVTLMPTILHRIPIGFSAFLQLDDREDVPGGIAEPRDGRSVPAHDAALVLRRALVELERDPALRQGVDGRVDVLDGEVEHRVRRRLVVGLGVDERRPVARQVQRHEPVLLGGPQPEDVFVEPLRRVQVVDRDPAECLALAEHRRLLWWGSGLLQTARRGRTHRGSTIAMPMTEVPFSGL